MGISLSILVFLIAAFTTPDLAAANTYSLLAVMGILLSYFVVWFISRNSILIREIKSDIGDTELPIRFTTFRKSSITEIVMSSGLAFLISMVGFTIANFSTIGVPSYYQTPLMVGFSLLVFVSIYGIYSLLPLENSNEK